VALRYLAITRDSPEAVIGRIFARFVARHSGRIASGRGGSFVSFGTTQSCPLPFSRKKWKLHLHGAGLCPAILSLSAPGHNVARRLWILRALSTPRRRVPRLSPPPRDHPLSTFFVSHLSCRRPRCLLAGALSARKGCLFCKPAKLVKVTSRRDGRQGTKGRRRNRERKRERRNGMLET